MSVRVLKLGYSAVTGERTVAAASIGSVGLTDDRGDGNRAFGLPPGNYLVLVPAPTSGRSGGPGLDDILQLTTNEVQRALQTARPAGKRPVRWLHQYRALAPQGRHQRSV